MINLHALDFGSLFAEICITNEHSISISCLHNKSSKDIYDKF